MDIPIEVINDEGKCVKEVLPNPNIGEQSESPANTNNIDKSEAENNSESDNVIVLNSSSETELLPEDKEESEGIMIDSITKEDRVMETETGKDTDEASPVDDTCVPMDIDEELTEKIPEVKTFTESIEEVSKECSGESNLEEHNITEKETVEAVSTIISEELSTNPDTEKVLAKPEASEGEARKLTAIEVIPDEEMEQEPINSTESGMSAVIELLDDDENEKTDDLSAQAITPEKMDIDKNEIEGMSTEVNKTANANYEEANCSNKEKEESSVSVEGTDNKQSLKDAITDEDDPKPKLDINTNIRSIINEKIKKAMDEEDCVFHGKECINYECEQKCKNFYKAPLFTLNFFKIPKKLNKNQFICDDCYNKAVSKYEVGGQFNILEHI